MTTQDTSRATAPIEGLEAFPAALDAPPVEAGFDPRAFLESLLEAAVLQRASDLHVMVGVEPRLRLGGLLTPIFTSAPVTAEAVDAVVAMIAPPGALERLDGGAEVDFGVDGPGGTRFRASAFRERRGTALALRLLAGRPPSLEELHLQRDLARVIYEPGGLILCAGHAGAGKTTTLASLLQELVERRTARLITLEDPIEYRLAPGAAYVEQRELGRHFATFEEGMRDALDASPDAIAVGELRDTETMRLALQAAEAGILVFATVHAYDATRAIGRVVDAFPPEDRRAARVALGASLRMIIAQTLLRPAQPGPRLPAVEVCRGSLALAAIVRDGKEHELVSYIESGRGHGMRTMDGSIYALVREGRVTQEEGLFFAVQKESLKKHLGLD